MSILLRGKKSLSQLARAILRSFGPDASSYPFSTLQGAYQTSAGPAAAAVNDPVGLELDALGTVGPELVTNGDFALGATGWTGDAGALAAIGGGVYNLGLITTGNLISQPCLTVGKWYKLVFSVTRFSVLGNFRVRIGGGAWGDLIMAISTVGTYTIYGQATVDTELTFVKYAASDFDIDNVSVKEFTGNHATQTTAINRPTVQRGLWNLLTYSQDFTNAAWPTSDWTNAASDTLDPFGGATGRKLTATAAPAALTRTDQVATSTTHTIAIVFKPGTFTAPQFLSRNNTTAISLTGAGYTGVNTSGADANGFWEFADYGSNGWKICRITCTSGFSIGHTIGIYFGATGAITNGTYFYLWGGLFATGTLTADQILQQGGIPLTTSAAGSNPTAGPYWASFNGTNQWIATASGGGASTGFFLCAAFQTAAAGVAQTLWSDRSGNTGLKLEITAGNVLQFSGGNGAAIIAAAGNAVSTGTAYVVTAKYDGSNLSVQLNNAAAVTAACVLSAGTAAITIGADPGGASGFFNGGFYDTPFIKNGLPTAAQEATIKSATGLRAGLVI